MRILVRLLAIAALIAPHAALALDPGKVPPIVLGTGSSGDVSAMSATPSMSAPSGTLARLLSDQASSLAAKAPLASPVFTGSPSMPTLTLTGSGSSGDLSGMSVTAGGNTRSLASWFPLLAPIASPTFTGTLTAPAAALNGINIASTTWPFPINPIGNAYITNAGQSIVGTTASEKRREYLLSVGLVSNKGVSNNTATDQSLRYQGDKVAFYPSVVGYLGTGDIWSINPVIELAVGSGRNYNAQGIELDLNNNESDRGAADGGAGLAAPVSYAMTLTGAGAFKSTAALGIFGSNPNDGTPIWHRGIVFSNSVSDSTIQDLGTARISLDIRGTHTYGLDTLNMVGTPIRLGNGQSISWRNAANTADLLPLQLNNGNNFIIGQGVGANVLAAPVVFSSDATYSIGNSASRASGVYSANFFGTLYTPPSSTSACTAGQFANDANYHYVCVATNTWKRVALTGF